MVLSRVRPGGLRASTQPGDAARVIDERGIENLGAPPGGWDEDIKKVKDLDWKHGEQITQDLWESLHPKVARDFFQQRS